MQVAVRLGREARDDFATVATFGNVFLNDFMNKMSVRFAHHVPGSVPPNYLIILWDSIEDNIRACAKE